MNKPLTFLLSLTFLFLFGCATKNKLKFPSIVNYTPYTIVISYPGYALNAIPTDQFIYDTAQEHCQSSGRSAVLQKAYPHGMHNFHFRFECKK